MCDRFGELDPSPRQKKFKAGAILEPSRRGEQETRTHARGAAGAG
jgi:hypothetical protein